MYIYLIFRLIVPWCPGIVWLTWLTPQRTIIRKTKANTFQIPSSTTPQGTIDQIDANGSTSTSKSDS